MAMSIETSATDRPALFVDHDGTLYKSSILEVMVKYAVIHDVFTKNDFKRSIDLRDAWQSDNNESTYLEYLDELVLTFVRQIAGKSVAQFDKVIESSLQSERSRRHRFPQILMSRLAINHDICVVSGSPAFALEKFTEDLPIAYCIGSTYETNNGMFTGRATSTTDKARVRQELIDNNKISPEKNVAIGDTAGDWSLLQEADYPIMFNPSSTLEEHGRKEGFPIVWEIKDNITVLTPDRFGKYQAVPLDEALDGLIIPG